MKKRFISGCLALALLMTLLIVPMAVSASDVDDELAGLVVKETLFNGAAGNKKEAIISIDEKFEYIHEPDSFGKEDGYVLRHKHLDEDPTNASFVVKVADTMRVDLAFQYSADNVDTTTYTYSASSDGTTWTDIADSAIKSEEYVAGPFDHARRDVITSLPEGTTQLKVTIAANAWWQPVVDFVKLWDAASEEDNIKVDDYLKGTSCVQSLLWMSEDESQWVSLEDNSFDPNHHYILDYDNWSFGKKHDNGGQYGYDDKWSIQRGTEKDAYLIIAVDDDMMIEVGTQAHTTYADIVSNSFFASADGETWTEVASVTERRTRDQDEKIAPNYIGIFDVVPALPKGTTQVKIVTSSGNTENSWWTPLMDYVNLRRVMNMDYLTKELAGYENITHIGFTDQGDGLNLLDSYENWTSGQHGVNYTDGWDTQRESNNAADATMVLTIDGSVNPKIQVATLIGQDLVPVTSNKYFASADGKNWTELRQVLSFDATNKVDGWVVRVEQISGIPTDATKVKVVTSTNNAENSWWSPLIDYIDVYAPKVEQEKPSLKLKNEDDSAQIMITDDFVVIDLDGKTMTIEQLSTKFDIGEYTLLWFDEDGKAITDKKTLIASGMVLKMMDGETVLVESALSVMNAGESKPLPVTGETSAVAVVALIALVAGVVSIIMIKKKRVA